MAALYGLEPDQVRIFEFEPALAIKVAVPRLVPGGHPATPTWPAASSSSPSSPSRCASEARRAARGCGGQVRAVVRTSLACDSTAVPSKKAGLAPPWSSTGLVKVNSLNCSGEMSPCSRSS